MQARQNTGNMSTVQTQYVQISSIAEQTQDTPTLDLVQGAWKEKAKATERQITTFVIASWWYKIERICSHKLTPHTSEVSKQENSSPTGLRQEI